MVDGTVRWIIQHEKRTLIVITLTFVTGLLLILPAVEEYSAAKDRLRTAREKVSETKRQLQNLPQLQRTFEQKKRELQALESKAVTQNDVEHLRGLLQKLIRETECEMREVTISEPNIRPWTTNDSVRRGTILSELGTETPFRLIQRNGILRIEGAMPNVYRFLSGVHQLNRFINAKQIKLERSSRDENLTQLEMQFEMFDLARKKA